MGYELCDLTAAVIYEAIDAKCYLSHQEAIATALLANAYRVYKGEAPLIDEDEVILAMNLTPGTGDAWRAFALRGSMPICWVHWDNKYPKTYIKPHDARLLRDMAKTMHDICLFDWTPILKGEGSEYARAKADPTRERVQLGHTEYSAWPVMDKGRLQQDCEQVLFEVLHLPRIIDAYDRRLITARSFSMREPCSR